MPRQIGVFEYYIKQVGFFKKKPMKRSAAVCYKRFPFALDSSVIDSLVRH